jgi:hypothetical protein
MSRQEQDSTDALIGHLAKVEAVRRAADAPSSDNALEAILARISAAATAAAVARKKTPAG